MTDEPEIYIVTLNNKEPISINADDPRRADIVYKANYKNVKIGKAKSLSARRENYYSTFGEENVNFFPIILTSQIDEVETIIKSNLDKYRVKNPVSKRKTEWLSGINKAEVIEIIVSQIINSNIKYELANGITKEDIEAIRLLKQYKKPHQNVTGKKLRGSYSVYKETSANKDLVSTEMAIISALVGYFFSSWSIWLISMLLLFSTLGTKVGLVIGMVITILWTNVVIVTLYSLTEKLEFSLVMGVVAFIVSWYSHDCGNLYWRDLHDAERW
jgi:hypothetical protein